MLTLSDHLTEYASPLIKAICTHHLSDVKSLVKDSSMVHAVNSIGESALHMAAIVGQVECIDLLIEAGADVNHQSVYGTTPLMVSAQFLVFGGSYEDCFLRLMEAHPRLDLQDHQGDHFLMKLPDLTDSYSKTRALLQKKELPLNLLNQNSQNALFHQTSLGHSFTSQFFIEQGMNVHQTDSLGANSFMWAAQTGDRIIMQQMIQAGVDIHALDHRGHTALFYAAISNDPLHLQYVLDSGLSILHYNHEGQSVIDFANDNQCFNAASYLQIQMDYQRLYQTIHTSSLKPSHARL